MFEVFRLAYEFLSSNAVLWPIVLALAAISVWLGVSKLHQLSGLITRIEDIIEAEHGDPKVHFVMLQQIQEKVGKIQDAISVHFPECVSHFQDINKIADLDPWQKCPIENCLIYSKLSNHLQALEAKIEQFETKAAASRVNTDADLKGIGAELANLAKEIIITLRDGRRGGIGGI